MSMTPRTNQKASVILFGEVLADIFPDRTVLGGAPFNVARHLKAFGQNPILITRLGKDVLRDEVLQAMSQCGMEIAGVQSDDVHPTGQVKVHFDGISHRFEILPLQAYDFIQLSKADLDALLASPALIYFGTLAQRHEVSRLALESLLDSTDATRFLDINLRAPWYDEQTLRRSLQHAQILKLNDDELEILVDLFNLSGDTPEDQAVDLLIRFDIKRAVVTCGKDGAWQINRDRKKIETGSNKTINLVDTVGAGDGFAAIFLLGSLLQWPIMTTLARANTFASSICENRGAIPEHEDFYKPFLQEWNL